MKNVFCWGAVFVLSLASSQSVFGQFFTLPPGDGLINTISDNGVAAGSFGSAEYFMWEVGVGGKVNIGGVPAGGTGAGGQAKISQDGTRICGTDLGPVSGMFEKAVYDVGKGSWMTLGGLGGSSDASISSGWGISGDGQSVVGLGFINAGTAHACVWRDGIVTDLGSTVAGESTRANGVNVDGSVVVGWQDGNGRQGAVWVNGVQELIFRTGGGPAQEAEDVTDDGRFVTGQGTGPFGGVGNAYRYDVQTNTYLELPNLASGGEMNMAATSITNDGRLIGGGTWPFAVPASFGTALIWEEGVGTMTVETYLKSKGFSEDDWGANFNFDFVTSISSDGQWIGGWGGTGFAADQSWVARIKKVPVILGDVNCDGVVDLLDVAPFVEALTTGVFNAKADINGDGIVDLLDVAPFVSILSGE